MSRPELRIDRLYRNTNNWKELSDEFNKMFRQFGDNKGIQNAGGFRWKSSPTRKTRIEDAAFIILTTNLAEPEWPDTLDLETGVFIYYGDNREPGELHSTTIGGNRFLKYTFELLHQNRREEICPILCFQTLKKDQYTFMKFLGLAAPGGMGISPLEDLVAVWRIKDNLRFQNYRAIFTVLDVNPLGWEFLDDLVRGVSPIKSSHCPKAWRHFVSTGSYNALQCVKSWHPRTKDEQLPVNDLERSILNKIIELTDREFEYMAGEIINLLEDNYSSVEVTPPRKDGGRDITGFYLIKGAGTEIVLKFAAEAKKWKKRSVGVKPVARLISRIKHRDFGAFITTSFFDKQVQQEVFDDGHPIKFIAGRDIVKLLIEKNYAGSGMEQKFESFLTKVKDMTVDTAHN